MSIEANKQLLSRFQSRPLYLFDNSIFGVSEHIARQIKINFVELFEEVKPETFFVSNEVMAELMNGPRNVNYGFFHGRVLNVEGSFDRARRENRFVVKEDGEFKVITLNKISSTDYNQILLCQNHPELVLVSNDRKLLKSAASIVPLQVLGLYNILKQISSDFPVNDGVSKILSIVQNHYHPRDVFGRN